MLDASQLSSSYENRLSTGLISASEKEWRNFIRLISKRLLDITPKLNRKKLDRSKCLHLIDLFDTIFNQMENIESNTSLSFEEKDVEFARLFEKIKEKSEYLSILDEIDVKNQNTVLADLLKTLTGFYEKNNMGNIIAIKMFKQFIKNESIRAYAEVINQEIKQLSQEKEELEDIRFGDSYKGDVIEKHVNNLVTDPLALRGVLFYLIHRNAQRLIVPRERDAVRRNIPLLPGESAPEPTIFVPSVETTEEVKPEPKYKEEFDNLVAEFESLKDDEILRSLNILFTPGYKFSETEINQMLNYSNEKDDNKIIQMVQNSEPWTQNYGAKEIIAIRYRLNIERILYIDLPSVKSIAESNNYSDVTDVDLLKDALNTLKNCIEMVKSLNLDFEKEKTPEEKKQNPLVYFLTVGDNPIYVDEDVLKNHNSYDRLSNIVQTLNVNSDGFFRGKAYGSTNKIEISSKKIMDRLKNEANIRNIFIYHDGKIMFSYLILSDKEKDNKIFLLKVVLPDDKTEKIKNETEKVLNNYIDEIIAQIRLINTEDEEYAKNQESLRSGYLANGKSEEPETGSGKRGK